MIPATIASINDETPTVKRLTLDLNERPFEFLPGQWIDCYLRPDPDAPVAGYSMTSSPRDTSTIDIAVKLVGDNPVTHHIHTMARVGDVLPIDGGHGDFYYTPDMSPSVVLIAGGIGITPLVSMLRASAEAPEGPKATLVYSAKSPGELAFRGDIDRIARRSAKIAAHYTITGLDTEWRGSRGRIDRDMLAGLALDPEALYYICGPTPFVTSVAADVASLGVPRSRVHYELWS